MKLIRNIILLSILHLIPCFSGRSQSWFPAGATWHYEYSSFLGSGLTTLEVLDEDTVIGAHIVKKILSTTQVQMWPDSIATFSEVLYVREENNVVRGYDKYLGWTLLYDFNAAVGDTLEMYFGGLSPSPFVIDSIGLLEVNGQMMTFQMIRFPSLFESSVYDELRVIEGIGSIQSHLFHSRTVIQPFDFPAFYFRCYEDAQLGLVNLSFNQVDCDYIQDITALDISDEIRFSLFPNPASDFFTIEADIHMEKYFVLDVSGRLCLSGNIGYKQSTEIEIFGLGAGVYFLHVMDEQGEIYNVRKFVVFVY